MSRWFNWVGSLLLFGLIGCGSDMHEILINKTLGELDNAGTKTRSIQEELVKAQKAADGNQSKYRDSPEVIKAIQNAEEFADQLKKVGLELAKVKQNIDIVKEPITPEQQAENSKKYRDKLRGAVESLVAARTDLQTTIDQIESAGKDAKDTLMPLQVKLREANGQFESLVRPR